MKLLLLLFVLLVSGVQGNNGGKVVEIATGEFRSTIAQGVWFVDFYAPWCGHCRKVEPVWERVAKELKDEDINVARIDGDADKAITDDQNIRAFPTFRIYIDGEEHSEFTDEFELERFVTFARRIARTRKLAIFPTNLEEAQQLYNFITTSIQEYAYSRLLLFSFVVWLMGIAGGVVLGVVITVREKEKMG